MPFVNAFAFTEYLYDSFFLENPGTRIKGFIVFGEVLDPFTAPVDGQKFHSRK